MLGELLCGRAEDMHDVINQVLGPCFGGCPVSALMHAAVVQVLGELLCGRAEDMPDVIKRESSRLPTGYDIGMVQVSAAYLPALSSIAPHPLGPAVASAPD